MSNKEYEGLSKLLKSIQLLKQSLIDLGLSHEDISIVLHPYDVELIKGLNMELSNSSLAKFAKEFDGGLKVLGVSIEGWS